MGTLCLESSWNSFILFSKGFQKASGISVCNYSWEKKISKASYSNWLRNTLQFLFSHHYPNSSIIFRFRSFPLPLLVENTSFS